jgi:carboxymethylenebutenolidase
MKKLIRLAVLTAVAIALWGTMKPTEGTSNPIPSSASSVPQPSYSQALQHSHATDRPIASGAIAAAPSIPVTSERVTYATVDGTPITGYLAHPEGATESLPGLIVIHEWWGLNDNIEAMTRRLAGEGYVALAVDLYAGEVAETPEEARPLTESVADNPAAAQDNLRQAYAYLQSEQGSEAIASIGWCFGGSWSLNTALLLPDQLDAAVIYYGGQLVLDPEQLATLEMPILGIFGSLDDNPSVETVRSFAAVLESLDKTAEIHIYEGADHAFANPSGTRYNAAAAEDAWKRTISFLNEYLT